ncbi:hypothetical protein ACFQNF_03885 [Iodobacter arcticus]|uniref:Uncharacterized protein n=1 Tax=Iodobacter arcticus TaxID=590593 RepID=A0ABW2QTC1_9NEIS
MNKFLVCFSLLTASLLAFSNELMNSFSPMKNVFVVVNKKNDTPLVTTKFNK